jgi:hypothetical protein
MKKLFLAFGLALLVQAVLAQPVSIIRNELGSGQPNATGLENATKWDDDIYHAPQYMPGYPTAATLYPRVINVKCVESEVGIKCEGYNWLPEMGRGEYLMIHPIIVPVVKPEPVQETVITVIPVREFTPIVIKKPVKKKKVVQRVCTQWSK